MSDRTKYGPDLSGKLLAVAKDLKKTTALLRRWIDIESSPIKRLEEIYDQVVKDTKSLLDALAKRGY